MEKKQSEHLVGCIVCSLLTVFGIVASVISMIGKGNRLLVIDFCSLVLIALIVYYAFIGYKKPHGNLLKYIILIRSTIYLINLPQLIQVGYTLTIVLQTIEIGLSCYIAGRLAKAKENLILMVLVTTCVVAGVILNAFSGSVTIGVLSPLVAWLDICVAYFLRYKEHKEAGLEDAPKK